MQLFERNKLEFELKIESLEDLWILSQFVNNNDIVYSTTERKVKIGDNNTKQVKKIIFVELKVNKTSFESETLRVSGEILNETEFTAVGQSHTLNFNVNDKIKVKKESILKFEEKILEDSIKSKKTKNFLVLFDKDDLVASEFSDFNFSVLFEKKNLGSKKYHLNEINEEEEKFKILEEFLKRDYSNVIFAGPGHYKDKLSKYIKDKIGLKSIVFAWQEVSNSSIQKVIKAINEKGVLSDSQLAKESLTVNHLLENIDKGSKFSYGFENTQEEINNGSVETFIVSNGYISEKRESNEYEALNELMRNVEAMNGELVIINSKNEPGKVLDGLGGIAAILRY